MIRRPPISTRTDTLFPYTTLFRSPPIHGIYPRYAVAGAAFFPVLRLAGIWHCVAGLPDRRTGTGPAIQRLYVGSLPGRHRIARPRPDCGGAGAGSFGATSTEERRVGEACVSTWEARGAAGE